MGLAIFSFVVQIIFLIVIEVLSALNKLTQGFSIFSIIVFIISTITSIGCIVYNAKQIKYGYHRGASIVGLVFSIIGTCLGGIFCIVVIVTAIAIAH